MDYEKYIKRCLELAQRGEYWVAPNPMVGAVLVKKPSQTIPSSDGEIIAEGWHERFGEGHAEVNCFRNYELRIKNHELPSTSLKDCTLFVSLEPCSHYGKTPPCAKLIIEKGVGHVVVGMLDPNPLVAGKGVQMLRDAGIEVTVGVCEKECRELNKRFLCLHEKKRPYVLLKWAQTADGYIDYCRELKNKNCKLDTVTSRKSNNESYLNGALAISTEQTKKIVHQMRAENMAIMVGTNTVLLDNPRLRNTHWEGRNPIRVTVDRHGILPMESKIFEPTKTDYPGIDPVIVYRERTDWPFICEDLGNRGIHSILVEGGTRLLEHILETGIWDEIHVEIAPELRIGEGVKAPQIELPEAYEIVDGHKMVRKLKVEN